MKCLRLTIGAVSIVVAASAAAFAQAGNAIPVTVDNFARAESDLYIANLAKEAGGLRYLEVSGSAAGGLIDDHPGSPG